MQRDFDLVVTILSELRDADVAVLSQADIEAAVSSSMPEAPSPAAVEHHLDILADAGLIAAVVSNGQARNAHWRLTWKGHDALDQQDEDEDDDEDDEDDDD